MLQDRTIDIENFIKFNSGGLIVADYDQIQAALIKRYKDIYGYDIDLANTTADGVFVNNLSLIINNILQSFKTLYSNLNVDTASGAYLTSLCRLSNVTRKPATASTAQLIITSTVDTVLTSGTIFVDTTGNEWVYDSNEDITILASNTAGERIVVTCSTVGPIVATAGSITQTLEASNLIVSQPSDAFVGSNEETDEELRARRDKSNGSQGITVLESLVGSLLAVEGIEDVFIDANNTDTAETTADTTEIDRHAVYIVVRKRDNVNVDDSVIGNIIYNGMTPGISTTPFTGTNGVAKSYEVQLDSSVSWIAQNVYWKEATPIAPAISMTITTGRNYTTDAENEIGNAILNYLNSVKIGEEPTANDIIITATYANNSAAYVINSVDISLVTTNPLTYYKYTSFTATAGSNNTVVFSFS